MTIASINTVLLIYITLGIFAVIILLLIFLPDPRIRKKSKQAHET